MSRRSQFALYVLLSVVDFAATVYLVTHGYADEANPLINGFTAMFASFAIGLAVYKAGILCCVVMLLRTVHRHNPVASTRLLFFANTLMLGLSGWHVVCLRLSQSM